jgi:hypothetical protein
MSRGPDREKGARSAFLLIAIWVALVVAALFYML